jgi:hypothetical protein
MNLDAPGADISLLEVTNISKHGFWLFVDNTEYFLPFAQFPWFQAASVAAILNVQRLHPEHLYWPDLDVDLALDSIRAPENYPLIARADNARTS